jgi:hypothetical protein
MHACIAPICLCLLVYLSGQMPTCLVGRSALPSVRPSVSPCTSFFGRAPQGCLFKLLQLRRRGAVAAAKAASRCAALQLLVLDENEISEAGLERVKVRLHCTYRTQIDSQNRTFGPYLVTNIRILISVMASAVFQIRSERSE